MPVDVRIAGCGKHLPSGLLGNDELAERFGVEPAWIERRTGIVERRVAAAGEAASDLALPAALCALASGGMCARDIDLIVLATSTPDTLLPSTACRLQKAVGARPVPAFDVSASCAGFIYALAVARSFLVATGGGTALVVASEVRSRFVDPQDIDTAVLYGDGAGAVVLASDSGSGGDIIEVELGADGADADALSIPAGGSALPTSQDTVERRLHFIRMDGTRMTKKILRLLVDAIDRIVMRCGVGMSGIDVVVPHQMNGRIVSAMARRAGLPEEKVFVNLRRMGNTAAASIPIALCDAIHEGRIRSHDLVLLAAAGAGLTWGTALVRWS